MQSHIVCICMIFFQNDFSNVSSNCLYEQIQSCIGYIYMIFPKSEFSYGSSSLLKLQMKSHIVYICMIEFSNASSNCLYEQMQSCISYIYTIFPQSEFSYGSSSRLKLHMGKNLAACPSLTPSFFLYKQNQESYDSKQFVPSSA